MMEPEVDHGEAEVYARVKLEAVRLIKERGVSYCMARAGNHTLGFPAGHFLAVTKRKEPRAFERRARLSWLIIRMNSGRI